MSLIFVSDAKEPIELLGSIQGFKIQCIFDEWLFKACRSTALETSNLPTVFSIQLHLFLAVFCEWESFVSS